MRLLKQGAAMLLCVILLTGTLSALAEGVNASLYLRTVAYNDPAYDSQRSPCSAVVLGDSLYVLTYSTLEKWTPGMDAPELVLENVSSYSGDTSENKYVFNKLLSDGEALYALNELSGQLWLLKEENGSIIPEKTALLDYSIFEVEPEKREEELQYYGKPQLIELDVIDGVLYMTATNYNGNKYNPDIYRWNMADGTALPPILDKQVQSLSAYKDGLLLGIFYDLENSYDMATEQRRPYQLGTLDPATGETKMLSELENQDIIGLTYEAKTDTAYYICGASLRKLAGLQTPSAVCAYFPTRFWSGGGDAGLMGEDMFFVQSYDAVHIRKMDDRIMAEGALTLYGSYYDTAHNGFLAAHPEIPVTVFADYFSSLETLTAAMVSGESTVDVLGLGTSYDPVQRLIDKGYALDLSGSEKLTALVDSMYPALKEVLMRDGKLYAVPINIYGNGLTVNLTAWEALGYTEEELPTTFMELMDIAEDWLDDFDEDDYEYNFFNGTGIKSTLLRMMMENFVNYCIREGEPFAFDGPVFQKLMHRIDAIDFSVAEDVYDAQSDDDPDAFWSKESLFIDYSSPFDIQYAQSRYGSYESRSLFLSLDEGLEPVVPAELTVMIVNPRSAHVEQAILYLENLVDYYAPEKENVVFFPEHNEPVLDIGRERDIKVYTQTVEGLKKDLEKAEPENRANIQENLKYFENILAIREENIYAVTEADIVNYRKNVAPYMCVTGLSFLNTWEEGGNPFWNLMDQYLQKAITVDVFMKEMAGRARMMALEDE